ncbi:mucin-5AC [Aplysia californica]|uniref:Mucin-5AC n=1 Tax=Aplysia californica TaxID=6500 RepID=A0ABM1A425_APLCA|nr:mucin-5AC [Aplysia californica]
MDQGINDSAESVTTGGPNRNSEPSGGGDQEPEVIGTSEGSQVERGAVFSNGLGLTAGPECASSGAVDGLGFSNIGDLIGQTPGQKDFLSRNQQFVPEGGQETVCETNKVCSENSDDDSSLRGFTHRVSSFVTNSEVLPKIVTSSQNVVPPQIHRTSTAPLSTSSSAQVASATTSTTNTSALPTLNLNLTLPPVRATITQGFGVKMVATSSSQQLIYRSVPPRPLSYTLTDVLEVRGPRGGKLRSKTAPVSTNAPEEYAQRFKSRPTTRPRVIEFDGSAVSSKSQRAMQNTSTGFPTARARIYIGHPKTKSPVDSPDASSVRSPGSRLHLQPLSHTPTTHHFFHVGRGSTPAQLSTSRTLPSAKMSAVDSVSFHGNSQAKRTLTKSAASSSVPPHPAKSAGSTSRPADNLKETSQSIDFSTSIPQDLAVTGDDVDDHIHNPDILLTSSTDCDDLSILPPPKKVLPKRELPWVFRYKVKRGMNTLSRIMASKPTQGVALHSSHAFS